MPMPPFELTEPKIIRIGRMAAALFAGYYAYFLWTTIFSYPTEPKVIGGLHLDQPLPQTTNWSPVWLPVILVALFAYATWPRQIPQGPTRKFIRGSFALLRIELFAWFMSIVCPGLGGIYLLLPMLTAAEIPSMLGQLFLSSAGAVVIMLMVHLPALIAHSLVIGPTILFATDFVSRRVTATPEAQPTNRRDAAPDRPAFEFVRAIHNMPKILAILIVGAVIVAGLGFAGLYLFIFWLSIFFSAALPFIIALGAVIGWMGKDWTWCAAVSLPIGFYFSLDRGLPGFAAIFQVFDFPPVFLATLIGLAIARKIRSRRASGQSDAPGSLSSSAS
ncbi:MAG: hypothetical protein H0V72_29235 [Bradyrhizobium sp.]|nr:hypothetical protein [Bradyrhizobium sp.]